MAKNSFIVYFNYREKLQGLNNAQLGKLFRAMLDYAIDDKEPEFSGELKMAFQFIKINMDEDKQKYEAKCKKNKENVSARWEYERIRNIQTNTNDTDNDNDNDNDNDYVYSQSIIIARARACETEKELEDFFVDRYQNYFHYWGFKEQDKNLFMDVVGVLVQFILELKTKSILYNQKKYTFESFLSLIEKFDEEDIRKIVVSLKANEEIRDKRLYILGAIINRAEEKR